MSRNRILWALWTLFALGLAALLLTRLFVAGDRAVFLPGKTAGVHHQIETSCETCHTATPFASQEEITKTLNKQCVTCHEDELEAVDDSHPRKKFTNPRMADTWEKLDARQCTTCHLEHQPEVTRPGIVTLPTDFCVACHSEGNRDVRSRPSHAGLGFETCASSGCHNFHDNKALYEDFLVDHAGEPWLADEPVDALAARRWLSAQRSVAGRSDSGRAAVDRAEIERYLVAAGVPGASMPEEPAAAAIAVTPEMAASREPAAEMPVAETPVAETPAPEMVASDMLASDMLAAGEAWHGSGHASAEVGCAACHAPAAWEEADGETVDPDAVAAEWVVRPDLEVCTNCHKPQAKTFALGRHGMRRHPELAEPRDVEVRLKALAGEVLPEDLIEVIKGYLADPSVAPRMTRSEARLPMHAGGASPLPGLVSGSVPGPLHGGAHGELTCATCHAPHEQDLRKAAVEACASCHADSHTQAYFESPHHAAWEAEVAGTAPAGSGVSCATCHMPKSERRKEVVTNHNQNDTLRPNEKMIRPVCMSCHGLGFAIDALADPDLVNRNFTGKPAGHVESIDWAVRRAAEDGAGKKDAEQKTQAGKSRNQEKKTTRDGASEDEAATGSRPAAGAKSKSTEAEDPGGDAR